MYLTTNTRMAANEKLKKKTRIGKDQEKPELFCIKGTK